MRHSTARCTCCHTCHASEKTSSRTFVPCTTCNSINCRPCLELCGEDWNQVLQNPNWSCPKCLGICPCQRCRNKIHHVSDVSGNAQDKPKHIVTLPSALKPKKKKRKFSTLIPHKKVRTPTNENEFCYSSNVSAPSVKRMRCSSTGASVIGIPDVLLESSSSRSPSPSSSDIETDNERLLDYDTIDCLDTLERKRLTDLIDRNKRCTNFIEQTEHLLRLIRAEQHNIVNQLKLFQKIKSSASPSAKLPEIPPPSSPLPMPAAAVAISTV